MRKKEFGFLLILCWNSAEIYPAQKKMAQSQKCYLAQEGGIWKILSQIRSWKTWHSGTDFWVSSQHLSYHIDAFILLIFSSKFKSTSMPWLELLCPCLKTKLFVNELYIGCIGWMDTLPHVFYRQQDHTEPYLVQAAGAHCTIFCTGCRSTLHNVLYRLQEHTAP